jgi:hypothetical protein
MKNEDRIKKNEKQRAYRRMNDNISTKKYEKTHKGFIMRMYRNMKSRITGVQKGKFHLYSGKELLSKDDFYTWAINNDSFYNLFDVYQKSGFDRKLAPSVDRIDSSLGYFIDNMEFVTHSVNSRRGSLNRNKGIASVENFEI